MVSAAAGLVQRNTSNRLTKQGKEVKPVTTLSFSSSCQTTFVTIHHEPLEGLEPLVLWSWGALPQPSLATCKAWCCEGTCGYRGTETNLSYFLWSLGSKIHKLVFPRGQHSFSILYRLGGTGFGKYYISPTFPLPTHLHQSGFFWQYNDSHCSGLSAPRFWPQGELTRFLVLSFLPKIFQDTMPLFIWIYWD